MTGIKIHCPANPGCIRREGPVWDDKRELLYWVDIVENGIHRYNPVDGNVYSWSTPEHVGFVIVKQDGEFNRRIKIGIASHNS